MKSVKILLISMLVVVPLQIFTTFGEKTSKIVRPLCKVVQKKITVDPHLKACDKNIYTSTVQCLQSCVDMHEGRQYNEPRDRINWQRKYNDLRQDRCGVKARCWDSTMSHKK